MSEPARDPIPPAPDGTELARLARLVRLSLLANGALLVLNLGVLYVVAVLTLDTPATVAGVEALPAEGSEKEKAADPRKEMREFFDRMTDLLDRAARKHGTNPADVLPSQGEVDAAVETRTMHSEASQLVMRKYREGFDDFDLPWPTVIPER
jgi:hypothetical protein